MAGVFDLELPEGDNVRDSDDDIIEIEDGFMFGPGKEEEVLGMGSRLVPCQSPKDAPVSCRVVDSARLLPVATFSERSI
ncbi:S6 kinase [Anopheles sinensis]|uniref:S6 kinase n=1 Tax=Anopheles sinensis TaxID=74873 RepID=A0A084WS40_ANOSI|nr:S6 kinase [Anopheles sinensis]